MSNQHTDTSNNHHVSVRYGDGAHSFWLTRGTTLGELAIHVSNLDTMHSGTPLTIDVIVETPRRSTPTTSITHASH